MSHGGKIVADALAQLGVKRIFSVPGESFLAVLDGLYESGIENVVCRQEGGAAMMAEAQGKLTGQPGIAFVTRGPGATNASAGVHVARQDSTPMILFVGQIDTAHRDREAFQEVNYRSAFGAFAKWATEVEDPARLSEYVRRAYKVAMSGRPGPVVVALPENVLSADRVEAGRVAKIAPQKASLAGPARAAMEWLVAAERPLVIVGGPHWSDEAAKSLETFAKKQGVPVAVGFRRQDYFDNRHPNYAGDLNVGVNPRLAKRLKEADRLLVLGSRLGDIETQGYTLVDPAAPTQQIFHVHADENEIGSVYPVEGSLAARADDFASELATLPPASDGWAEWTAAARADYEAWLQPQQSPGDVKLEEVIGWLSDTLPADAILTNGAGNYAAWLHRYFVYKQYGTQLAPTSGSMGYGFPAAIAASLEHPDRQVVCLAGDGCFQMTLNEMSTAVQSDAKPIVIVVNNGRYGTIRMHQERTYPGRISGTMLANPDFAGLAVAYGGFGERVTTGDQFADAFERAAASGKLAVIELVVDEDALSPSLTLSGLKP